MVNISESSHIPHKDKNVAFHIEWDFRNEAVISANGLPLRPNFYPLATELRNWMLQEGQLWFFSPKDKSLPGSFTNPYTYDGSILAITYAQVINDSHAFSEDKTSMDPVQAEIKRIRLYTENVLYAARLSEAFIKQLLFCTTFLEGDYRRVALGSLLSKECSGCRASKEKRHKLSLLGSLAHRYRLCGPYEKCLHNHMGIVNRRRDLEAAHSGVATFTDESTLVARKQLGDDLTKIGNEFIHMLQHISDIEQKMIEELNPRIKAEAKRLSRTATVILRANR